MRKTEKPSTAVTTFIRDLRFGDRFMLPEHSTVYVAQRVCTADLFTSVAYRVEGDDMQHEFTRRPLSIAWVLA